MGWMSYTRTGGERGWQIEWLDGCMCCVCVNHHAIITVNMFGVFCWMGGWAVGRPNPCGWGWAEWLSEWCCLYCHPFHRPLFIFQFPLLLYSCCCCCCCWYCCLLPAVWCVNKLFGFFILYCLFSFFILTLIFFLFFQLIFSISIRLEVGEQKTNSEHHQTVELAAVAEDISLEWLSFSSSQFGVTDDRRSILLGVLMASQVLLAKGLIRLQELLHRPCLADGHPITARKERYRFNRIYPITQLTSLRHC